MENGRFFHRFLAVVTLVFGVAGCEDRLRPTFGGVGNGIGPLCNVTTPTELDTVHTGTNFPLDIHVSDEDGIDSIWVTLEPNIEDLPRVSGSGDPEKSVGYFVTVPDSMVPPAETLYIHVQARDVLGDTGVVFTRRVLIQ